MKRENERGALLLQRAIYLCSVREPSGRRKDFSTMPSKGMDSNSDMTDYAGYLRADGFEWVARYINPGKEFPLSHAEAAALTSAGLWIVSIWERGNPTQGDYFNTDTGTQAGIGAVQAAQGVGQPLGTPIYLTVDYDADPSDLDAITCYFSAVHSRIRAAGYLVGVYASGLVCRHLSQVGLISHTWLTQSRGFAGYADWLPQADIVQGVETNWHGVDCDLDTGNGRAGGWRQATA